MTLEQLRAQALFQNSIDVWIKYCQERSGEWYDTDMYRNFVRHLQASGVKMQKFPLCIKESGGMYERTRDKAKFLEELSKIPSDDAAAFTIKLWSDTIAAIRGFQVNQGLEK